jgi:hypothetical protein
LVFDCRFLISRNQNFPWRNPMRCCQLLALFLGASLLVQMAVLAGAEEKPADKPKTVALADGKVELTAPAGWTEKKPTTNIVLYEFAAPAAEGDETDGRLTIGATGGGVDANVARWIAQVVQPDGKASADRAEKAKLDLKGATAHIVDISGTYVDRPRGPLGPTVNRENYRLLAAMIDVGDLGQFFVKFYGPRKTIAAHEKAFEELVKSAKVAK